MNGKKIAILLDFDGPLFNNDEVKTRLSQLYHISEIEWSEIYESSRKGKLYVDYGRIIAILSKRRHIREEEMFNMLFDSVLKDTSATSHSDSDLCSQENRKALSELLKIGKVELITQGHEIYQWLKIIRSEAYIILEKANKELHNGAPLHEIKVIPENKIDFLKERLLSLSNEGYSVIQLDDRVEPLQELRQFANDLAIPNFAQIRVCTGKYAKEKSPEGCRWVDTSSISAATNYIKEDLITYLNIERAYSVRMRR